MLAALAEHRDVHLWLPHPSPALWDAVPRSRRGRPAAAAPTRRAAVPRPSAAVLARPRRPGAAAALPRGAAAADAPPPRRRAARRHAARPAAGATCATTVPPTRPDAAGSTGRPQRAGARLPRPGPAGRGAARGAARPARRRPDPRAARHPGHVPGHRGVRAADLGRVRARPTWSTDADAPGHRLRVRLADRALRQTNPLLATVATLLELADGRVTASQVLDLAASAPVRRRFGSTTTISSGCATWAARSGVRWGLDATHRGRSSWAASPQNTWRAGPRPGAARGGDGRGRTHGGTGSAPRCRSTTSALRRRRPRRPARRAARPAGRGARRAAGEQPLGEWLGALVDALDAAHRHDRATDAWQPPQPARELADGRSARPAQQRRHRARSAWPTSGRCSPDRLRGPAHPGELPHRHADRLHAWCRCARCRTGWCACSASTTGSSRAAAGDGDDVLARDPLVGERDPRSEDRQLLLDAVMAATEHLVIIYTGPTSAPAPAGRPRCRSASCSTPRRADGRPDGRARGARATSAAALRRPQLRPGRARRRRARSASTRPRSPGPAAAAGSRGAGAAVPARAAAAAAGGDRSSTSTT